MSRARRVLCRACLALAAVLAVLLLLPLPLPLPLPRAPAPDPDRVPTRSLTLEGDRLQPDDVFIAVKTTRKNHGPRLRLLLRTWISRAPRQTFIFTDGDDPELQMLAGGRMINTNCSAVRTRQALCCKMSVEYDKFLESGRKTSTWGDLAWTTPSKPQRGSKAVAPLGSFMSTAERVRLPDDCTVGYIVEGLLGARLLHSPLFHSHLENLQRLPSGAILQQVTLSYGGPENPHNVVNVAGSFNIQQDPTRFQSVHCLLYPDTHWCPMKNRVEGAFQ
ncbi:beta-1,3-N-acetylglucosaminyltransferase radical fringe isoform X1 [Mus musculus]|uniref:beta-1,3-N-acetylglucosaminyltransferase radical fringe isoform X1 n=1 Tax=Mus musculus TaxID=10090 RepID=UPI0003D736EE|nr:beta-1,3-N-acetylglucosaminyltransferase radical fringe isoform X1 [Mus musculus]|eukprot:XP_006532669.1 PREDICTED: beta-1,3-N-acetylglucosaminyltransferase radical fringe isoform X1 [Mus musculus]